MGKTAVVLGGGGSRGSYEIGVWRALRELEIPFDVVTGTSVGALNGAMMLQGDFDRAQELWYTISTEKVLNIQVKDNPQTGMEYLKVLGTFSKEFIRGNGSDATPLRRLLESALEERRIRSSPVDFGLTAMMIPEIKPLCPFLTEIPQGMLIDYLMASCSFFPAMQPQSIGGNLYIDGGYYDNVPVEMAIRRGCIRVIAVDLDSPGIRRPYDKTKLDFTMIRSEWALGHLLIFHQEEVQRNIERGYYDAMKAFGRFDGAFYTFPKGAVARAAPELVERVTALYERIMPETARVWKEIYEPVKWRVLRYLRQFHRVARAQDLQLVLAGIENAGKLLGISAERVYAPAEYHAEIVRALAGQLPTPIGKMEEWARENRSKRKEHMGKLLPHHDAKAHVAAFMAQISLALQDEKERRKLWALALLFPAEFAAAVYVRCMETKREEGLHFMEEKSQLKNRGKPAR